MTSLSLSREQFATERRSEQDALAERLSPLVAGAFADGDIDLVLLELLDAYHEVYDSEVEGLTAAATPAKVKKFIARLIKAAREMLTKATPDSDVASTALALANATINDATLAAYSADVEMEWVSLQDDSVRHTHEVADGQRQPVGAKFTVGEALMDYPGDISAPIAEWINCRCALRPVRKVSASAEFRDISQEERDRDADAGRALPDGSFPIDNCEDLKNAIQAIGRAKDPDRAKAHIRKRKSALGCPDVELPETWALTASAQKEQGDWFAIMAVPTASDPVHEIGPEDKHATLVYFGELEAGETVDTIAGWVEKISADAQPFTALVKGIEDLGHGDDEGQAKVWLLEPSDLNGIHEGLMANEDIKAAYDAADITKYPEFTPHVTIGYDRGDLAEGEDGAGLTSADLDQAAQVTEITFDRLAVWHGSSHADFPLGESMPDENATPEATEETLAVEDTRIPWHGVLAPEGVRSGDGRQFANLGRTRNLPLPLTWQKVSADGHDQNITVAAIEKVQMIDGLMHGSGHFLSSVAEVDEVVGLISEFGRFGVSVDADDIVSASFDEETETETYEDPRISSACIVSIPAFPEAYVALGFHPVLDATEDVATDEEPVEDTDLPLLKLAGVPDSFRQAALAKMEVERLAAEDWSDILTAADVAPGKTEDGPGWITDPIPTDRLRDYWVRGPGAAKIGWGTPGDFNRCRINVAEYVSPQHLNGYCANRHYDALGVWPGQEASAEGHSFATAAKERLAADQPLPTATTLSQAPALTLVASAAGWEAPSEFFTEPVDCHPDDGIRITEDGRVFGYVAEWGVCHIGYDGMCKEAPPSASDYAYFRTGEVNTPDGPVKVGALTAATGHADPRAKAMPAAAHYDNTGSTWAYVATGENERGIWFSGMIKPGTPAELLNDVVASGRISGDWRPIGRDLELVAGLTVNVPGFPIVQTRAAATNGRQLSLVAAGVPVPKIEESPSISLTGTDADSMSMIASLVVDEMESRQARRARMDTIKYNLNSKGGQ